MDIQKFDLNLLKVFNAVFRTRSVSRAAEELGLSQPATSQALTRLRMVLRDGLFVRSPTGVEPTAKAVRMAKAVGEGMLLLQGAVMGMTEFHPPHSARRFKLHLSDAGEAMFLPKLVQAFAAVAPGAGIDCENLPEADISEALDTGRLDFALGLLPNVSGTESAVVLQDFLVLLMRSDHAFLAGRNPAAPFEAFDPSAGLIVVRPYPGLSQTLAQLGWLGHVAMHINHFFALPRILAGSELAALVPMRVASFIHEQHPGLSIVAPARPQATLDVSLHWSKRFEHDPAHQWLRDFVLATLSN